MPRLGSRVRVPSSAPLNVIEPAYKVGSFHQVHFGWRRGQAVRQRPAKPLSPVRFRSSPPLFADVAQLVEHNLAKVGVAGSSPVFRSKCSGAGFLAGAFLLPRYSKLLVIRLPLGRRWSIQGLWGETGPLPYVTCGFANRAQCASPLTKQEIRRPARNLAGLLRYFHHSGVSSPNVTILPSS